MAISNDMKSGGIDRVVRGLDNNKLATVSSPPSRRDAFAGVLKEAVRERAREGTDRVRYAAVERAVQFMRDRYWEQHSSRRLAEVAMMSRFHFHRTFTAYTGTSPGRYLAALRMQAAKRLLVRSNLRVADICFEVGYGSVGTFTSTFADRKSTRLNSSHLVISYAVFCLKKKKYTLYSPLDRFSSPLASNTTRALYPLESSTIRASSPFASWRS